MGSCSCFIYEFTWSVTVNCTCASCSCLVCEFILLVRVLYTCPCFVCEFILSVRAFYTCPSCSCIIFEFILSVMINYTCASCFCFISVMNLSSSFFADDERTEALGCKLLSILILLVTRVASWQAGLGPIEQAVLIRPTRLENRPGVPCLG